MLDQAFEALNKHDWGTDLKLLQPIDDAVVATHSDAAGRKALEVRLAKLLSTNIPRDAKDYICRKLMVIGTAASVPALAQLLADKDNSHMARYALERIPMPEATEALRAALPKLTGALKVGVIASIGARRDAASVAALAALLGDADTLVARSAVMALGTIRTPEASKALAQAKPTDAAVKSATVDASLACAEGMLASGKKAEAQMIYRSLAAEGQPKHVRLAATRGMLSVAGKQ